MNLKKLLLQIVCISAVLIFVGCNSSQSSSLSNEDLSNLQKNMDIKFNNLQKEIKSLDKNIVSINNKILKMQSKDVIKPITKMPITTTESAINKENSATSFNGKAIVGEQEWVWFDGVEKSYKARIDTGATTSSFSATNIEYFERNGAKWVKFQVPVDVKDLEVTNNVKTFELPIVRFANIRQSSAKDEQRRPVVKAWIRLGPIREQVEFTLIDRSKMAYPVLLGREFFRDIIIVDVSKSFIYKKVTKESNQKEK